MPVLTAPTVALVGVAGLSAATWIGIALSPRLRQPGRHRLPHRGRAGEAPEPPVAIVCPGRDEAAFLPDTLPRLLGQRYGGPLRVVFIDDASGDATPEIVKGLDDPRLLPVRLDGDPPPGWVGKCWAIAEGVRRLEAAEAASGMRADWLCFTDADIVWHPDLLRSAMAHVGTGDADVLALAPTLEFGGALEAIVQLQLVLALALLFPFEHAMDPARETALTGGAFILVRRSRYDQVGGHDAVRDKVVEDLALGRLLKKDGARMRIALAGELQRCRMYEGWQDMREGLTKNVAAGLEYRWITAIGLLVATLICNVSPPLVLITAASLAIAGVGGSGVIWAAVLAVAAWAAQAWCFHLACRITRLPPVFAFSAPLGSLIYAIFLIESFAAARLGGNTWKGRRYRPSVGDSAGAAGN